MTREFAPAKVNLYLHVGPLGADGYHPLESWMVFADVGDWVAMAPSDRLVFTTSGPFAEDVPKGEGSLVERAYRIGASAGEGGRRPCAIDLEKNLPVASGLGGGSADAAAVLRLIGREENWDRATMESLALNLGSDCPACIDGVSVRVAGRGERLSEGPAVPPLPAVLVNPGAPLSTEAVFRAFDRGPVPDLEPAGLPVRCETVAAAIETVAGLRNDLQSAAIGLCPAIAEVLAALGAAPVARMSGSGATCFALCETGEEAEALSATVRGRRPSWWVRACSLS